MNEQKLLEKTAKAAEYDVVRFENGAALLRGVQEHWNPLVNDGDALRLAVNLGIVIQPICHDEYDNLYAAAYAYDEDGMEICSVREVYTSDPYAATRRAIVRAAAEIGKGMK